MKCLGWSLMAACAWTVCQTGMARDQLLEVWVDQSFFGGQTLNLNQLASEQLGENLGAKTVTGVQVLTEGYGTLTLSRNGMRVATQVINSDGYIQPLMLNPTSPSQGNWSLTLNGEIYLESVEILVAQQPVTPPNPPRPPVPPVPTGPSKAHIEYQGYVPEDGSATFTLQPGFVKSIKVNWTDWTEGAEADFYLNGVRIARAVDVASDGRGATIAVNQQLHGMSTLVIVIDDDPAFIYSIDVEYAGSVGTTQPLGIDQKIDYNREIRKNESATFILSGGFLHKLAFAWTDNGKNAEAVIRINGENVGRLDVNSNGSGRELVLNRFVAPGSQLQIAIERDHMKLHTVRVDYQ